MGGVPEKVEAAKRAGLVRVYIPRENMLERFENCGVEVMMLDRIQQAVEKVLLPKRILEEGEENRQTAGVTLIASAQER